MTAAPLAKPIAPPAFQTRAGQKAFEHDVRVHRVCGLLARRRYGKTTIAGRIALRRMMKVPGETIVFGSVKVDLGRDMVREEAKQLRAAFLRIAGNSQVAFASGGKELEPTLSEDDFAQLYESTRLEFRLHHDRHTYSRTLIVALTPDCVGLGGFLIMDEVGRVRRFGEVLEAVLPIIQDNASLRCIYTTTPPPDDTHPSFALLAPPIGAELAVRPEGNTYKSELGIFVRRVTVFDAQADGIPLYDDDTGAVITADESRRRANDKDAWDRNFGCHFVIGGTSVCGLQEIDNAQRKGVGKAFCEVITDDLAFDAAVARLESLLGDGPVGTGWDLASTEKETSNPSSFTITEKSGSEFITRAALLWKTGNPALQIERACKILHAIARRKSGGSARRLGIDATGDRLFAKTAATAISRECGVPVELVVASETVVLPGYDSSITRKTALGDRYVAALQDNRHTYPPERYFREDHRMPKKIRGIYVCEPDGAGRHGDTFESGKIAQEMVETAGSAMPARIEQPASRTGGRIRNTRRLLGAGFM